MTLDSRMNVNARIGGVSFSAAILRESDGQIGQVITLPAAKTGALSTRTDDDEGTITAGNGHGITTGATFDLYWDGGRRYNVTAGTVAGASVPFSGGSGDNLPDEDSVVTTTLQTTVDFDVNCDLLEAIAAYCLKDAHVAFLVSTSVELDVNIDANEAWAWWSGNGFTNPLAGHVVTSIKASQGDTTARDLSVGVLYNSA